MKRITLILLACLLYYPMLRAIDLTRATIVYDSTDHPLVSQMAKVLSEDIERVSGVRPAVSTRKVKGQCVILSTTSKTSRHKELRGRWEQYAIDSDASTLYITGSTPRGLAYGVFHVSERIGVSPWYWFADVPVDKSSNIVHDYTERYTSAEPTIKYRGIFLNDEDWGLKTWAEKTYEAELGDIGPKTYDRICELILRLRGNMLAPAMHPCTGAFYSHPESQIVADKWGIMITTSHCEPLLFNNASKYEWDKKRDGEWNYETNSATIIAKLDNRIRETARYDNIYTMGMRGLHDEAMKGSKRLEDRARTLDKVIKKQREILEKYKKRPASSIQQIFVPYKETLDIYDAGLKVPEDITLVWPDDNYGYMKRVSNPAEKRRSGRSGVYYHISYCGSPHDNLWLSTTAPQLMYEELLKAYSAGADRYWLLNVGDIKPMEIAIQMFMDMAYDINSFSYENANRYQALWLSRVFGEEHLGAFQFVLDGFYRLAWDRKPEFMGYEMEWDSPEYCRLYDTDFSFETGTAQKRLVEYQDVCNVYDAIERRVAPSLQPALFEMLGYAVHSAYQMNRKFLYAQANHETGQKLYADLACDADDAIQRLLQRYNTMLDGKWAYMISEVIPGYKALYQNMPELGDTINTSYRLPDNQRHPELRHKIDLRKVKMEEPFRMLEGIGTDWHAIQMGQPLEFDKGGKLELAVPAGYIRRDADSLSVCVSVVPMWPVAYGRSNRLTVSVDGSAPVTCENKFKERGREWKIQVLENRKEFLLTFPLDKSRSEHTISLGIVDPGQIVQKITVE